LKVKDNNGNIRLYHVQRIEENETRKRSIIVEEMNAQEEKERTD